MNAVQCRSPTNDKNEHDKDQLDDRLQSIIVNYTGKNLTILMPDLNYKVGMDNTGYENIMERHALIGRKEREWREICKLMCVK